MKWRRGGSEPAAERAPSIEPEAAAGRLEEEGVPASERRRMEDDVLSPVEEDRSDGREPRDEVPNPLMGRAQNGGATNESPSALFSSDRSSQYRSRWTEIQASFIDEPRAAVEQADRLVEDVLSELSELFGREKETLRRVLAEEASRTEPSEARNSTEELRLGLQRYRSFFTRLLSF
jgi:hypothetical protein